MAYEHITFGQLKALAHKRVGADAFWTETEMGVYIGEALRVWNLITGHFRGTASVPTVANDIFYTTTLLTASRTDQDILNEMQHHTLETANLGASLASDMWTIGEWVDYLNGRTALFLRETKLVLTRDTFASVVDQTRYDLAALLDADLLQVWRVAWLDANGVSHGLTEADLLQYDSFLPEWTTAAASGEPEAWTGHARPTLTIEVIPAPDEDGTLAFLYVRRPTQLPQVADGTLVGIPSDFASYIKWGAMADMFAKEGQANDPPRAQYCEARFREGIAIAKVLIQSQMQSRVEFNGVPLDQDNLYSLDFGRDGWQADSSTPEEWFPVAATQIGIHPAHAAGGGTLDIDGLKNAVVPTLDGTFVDIPQSEVERIVDYAHHLASFKQGGQELQNSIPLLQNFLNAARDEKLRSDLESIYDAYLGKDVDPDTDTELANAAS